MSNNVILGSGLSGLIWAYTHPDHMIISNNVGGFVSNKMQELMVTIFYTENTSRLFGELNINRVKNTYKIRYYHNNEILEIVTPELKQLYVKRKTGECPEIHTDPDIKLGSENNHYNFLHIDMHELINALEKKVKDRIIIGEIVGISENYIKVLQKGQSEPIMMSYNKLVSTLPATVFWTLYSSESCAPEMKSNASTYILTNSIPKSLQNTNSWNNLYLIDDEFPFHRIIHKFVSANYVLEFAGKHTKEALSLLLKSYDVEVLDYSCLNYAIADCASSKLNVAPKKYIQFLGRFAERNHRIKIDNVLDRAYADVDKK